MPRDCHQVFQWNADKVSQEELDDGQAHLLCSQILQVRKSIVLKLLQR